MIGRWLARAAPSARFRKFAAVLGVPDFHTHLRLAWIRDYVLPAHARLCELGCGMGIASIELVHRNPGASAIGYEADEKSLESAHAFTRALRLQERLRFQQWDVDSGLPPDIATADCVLILDVLEHLQAPREVASKLVSSLRPGARVLISVPTPLYARVFGRRYHVGIGHLHEGFTLEQLDELFTGLERGLVRYSTGPLSWPGVFLTYRLFYAGEKGGSSVAAPWGAIAAALSAPFRWLDSWNGKKVSCSMFVEYKKTSTAGIHSA